MSDYLFAHPSLLSGIARSLDLGGVFDTYNDHETPREADARAIEDDWRAVGADLTLALDTAEREADGG